MQKEIIQGTEDWLKWRHEGIGASEAPIILGVSRFKTAMQLWREKTNPTPPKNENNYIQQKGHEIERKARNLYELETMKDWKPRLAVHGKMPRVRASLDGWNDERHAIWECKYLGAQKYSQLLNGVIPNEYWPQLMHQVFVTGAKEIHFTGVIDSKKTKGDIEWHTVVIPVDDNCREYITKLLVPAISQFINCIDTKTPPGISTKDFVKWEGGGLKPLLTQYKNIKERLKKLEAEEKTLKDAIFKMTLKAHNKVMCGDFKITESISTPKESVDYEAFVKSIGKESEAEQFKKQSTPRKTRKIIY